MPHCEANPNVLILVVSPVQVGFDLAVVEVASGNDRVATFVLSVSVMTISAHTSRS